MPRIARLFGLILLSVTLVAGCTGVPSSSDPEIVRGLGEVSSGVAPSIAPLPGADPRTIVQGFLQANVSDADDHHAAAKAFLTADARGKWNDSTTTVLDTFTVGVSDDANNVAVTGEQVGSVDSHGIYTPDLSADPAGDKVSVTFVMRNENGQWRIQQPPNGLIVQRSDFQSHYSLETLYFFDLSQQHLVPDIRFSPLSDPQQLASWRLNQLLTGPRPDLMNAVQQLPSLTNSTRATVTVGQPIVIELPGSSQFESGTLNRLAAQLSVNFDPDSTFLQIRITDSGKIVGVPGVGTTFGRAQFPVAEPTSTSPALYYLNDKSALVDQNAAPVAGALASGQIKLTSVALSGSSETSLRAAGTVGPPGQSRLLVGTLSGGLSDSGLPAGDLSAPAWSPNYSDSNAEVWVGDGDSLMRVRIGHPPEDVSLGSRAPGNGTIRSIRFSPEGARISLVIAATDGTAQLWIGTLVRAGDSVRVDTLTAVTPPQLVLRDVSWSGESTFFFIATDQSTGTYGIWSVRSDGSSLAERSHVGLPKEPDTIAAASGVIAWVSADGAVFEQSRASNWVGPSDSTTKGTSPTYAQ